MADSIYRPWRTGRKVGRTIYEQVGLEPSDDDVLIGVMDTRDMADGAVTSRNFVAACPEGVTQLPIRTLTDMDAQLDRLKARADRLRAALDEIASRPAVERNPDGVDQAAHSMQLIAREALFRTPKGLSS